jgi:hypothetical protein
MVPGQRHDRCGSRGYRHRLDFCDMRRGLRNCRAELAPFFSQGPCAAWRRRDYRFSGLENKSRQNPAIPVPSFTAGNPDYAMTGSRSGIWLGIFGTRVRGWPLTPVLPAPKRSILPVPVLQS